MSDSKPEIVTRRVRVRHAVQREIGRLAAPFWVPTFAFVMRFILGYHINDLAKVRAEFKQIREASNAPLLICANHLTLIDSFVITWALIPTWRMTLQFSWLPWNTPERRNFAATWVSMTLVYLAKCIPISRGGSRSEIADVLGRVSYLLIRGELALLFPEGGRSRTGRVTSQTLAWGVGRIVAALPDCRVACVYLRGHTQETWGSIPNMGDRFDVSVEVIEPKSDHRGARRSRDLAAQIVAQLSRMEKEYFDGRE